MQLKRHSAFDFSSRGYNSKTFPDNMSILHIWRLHLECQMLLSRGFTVAFEIKYVFKWDNTSDELIKN